MSSSAEDRDLSDPPAEAGADGGTGSVEASPAETPSPEKLAPDLSSSLPPHRTFFIHYSEIGLKRGNRPYFEAQLVRNIQLSLRGLRVIGVHRLFGRIRIDQDLRGDETELRRRLTRIHGLAHFEPVERFPWDLEAVEATLREWAAEGDFESFAIRVKRLEKKYPYRSREIGIRLGSLVQSISGARVDLGSPEQEFHFLVFNKELVLSREKVPGCGGLPVGTAGRVLHLLSGGIDSPVAAERLFRRGCHLQFVHFHSSPFTDRSSIEKTMELADIITENRIHTKLYLVPLGLLQGKIVSDAPARWRVMLYRRWMLRIAEVLARRNRCVAIGSGENLAQVASQTLPNLTILDQTIQLPLLRPLLTYDKQEIIEEAKKLGTFEVSIEPHADCCGYLLPRKPATDGTLEEIEAVEAKLDLSAEFDEVLRRIETHSVGMDDGNTPAKN